MKTASQAMQYEAAGSKKASKGAGKRATIKLAEQLSTPSLIWLLVKRHKVAILAIGNLVLLANFIFPEWPQLVLGLIGK